MKIELVYFDGCPNFIPAKENLLAACKALNIDDSVIFWEQKNSQMPTKYNDYGSPTILVDGHDIAHNSTTCTDTGNCRLYTDSNGNLSGVPTVEAIQNALQCKLTEQEIR